MLSWPVTRNTVQKAFVDQRSIPLACQCNANHMTRVWHLVAQSVDRNGPGLAEQKLKMSTEKEESDLEVTFDSCLGTLPRKNNNYYGDHYGDSGRGGK